MSRGRLEQRRLKYLGSFTHLLNIRPWEWDQLWLPDMEALMRAVDDLADQKP